MSKTTVLQGLNLISAHSIVNIECNETEDVKKLLKLITGFHPIFAYKYAFSENILQIETDIPFIWKEASEYIQKLANGKISYEDARKYIVETIISNRLKSMSTLPILYSALQKRYEVTPTVVKDKVIAIEEGGYTKTFNRRYTLGCGRNSQITASISSTKDSIASQTIQRDKYITNLMIERLGLPIVKWELIKKKSDIEKILGKYEKPVVIKPVGLTGGQGVTVGIKTVKEAEKAFDDALGKIKTRERKEWQTKIMIQEQVQGEDYRLLVIDGKLEIATKRIPAFVIGDGQKNIKQLIEETNNDPRRDTTNPAHTLKPIIIDEPLEECLKEQKLSLKDIPEKNEKIYVRKVASMSQGGITEDFTDSVGSEIKYIVESIAKSTHAFALGVDVLCKDLSSPLTKENGGILEINTMPEAYLNLFPVIGEDRSYIAKTFVEKLLKDNHTKQIVVVGNPTVDIPTLLKQKTLLWSYLNQEDIVGEYRDGEIRINGLDINKGLEKAEGVEALKINASLDAIIIHHRDWDEVEEVGFGFNEIDLLVVTKDTKKDDRFKNTLKYWLQKKIKSIRTVRG